MQLFLGVALLTPFSKFDPGWEAGGEADSSDGVRLLEVEAAAESGFVDKARSPSLAIAVAVAKQATFLPSKSQYVESEKITYPTPTSPSHSCQLLYPLLIHSC